MRSYASLTLAPRMKSLQTMQYLQNPKQRGDPRMLHVGGIAKRKSSMNANVELEAVGEGCLDNYSCP